MKSVRNILAQVRSTVREVSRTATAWYDANYYGDTKTIPPPDEEEKVLNFVMSLWRESKEWRQKSFGGRMRYWDPYEWFKFARRLEEGMHWDVWGRRNEGDDDKWKQEISDPEIEDQIRLKKSHLTSNWHDIDVMPNIKGMQEVLDQERQRTDWGTSIMDGVQRGLTEGMAVWYSFIDRTRYPDGVAREMLLDNESLFPTPFAMSKEKLDGCWYLAIATLVPEQQIYEMYPKLLKSSERMRFESMSNDIAKFARLSLDMEYTAIKAFTHTSMTPMITLFVDDPTIEHPQVNQEEIALEHQATSEGVPIKVYPDQNHKAHIEAHLSFINSLMEELEAAKNQAAQGELQMPEDGQPAPKMPGVGQHDLERMGAMAEVMAYHVREHVQKVKSDQARGINPAENRKYPAGRKIVIAGGIVLEDEPVRDVEDWRDLVNIWYYEKLRYSFWGRGVPEILFNTNKTLDTMLSRDADLALSSGMQKAYFDEEDKENLDEAAYDNDPTKPIFVKRPPTFRGAAVPPTNGIIYSHMKSNAQRQLGVNDTSFGKSPGANTSAEMVKTLQTQNQVMLTGEPNQRLSDTIEKMIKTRMRLWKEYYTEPRTFFFQGTPKAVTLSKMVSQFEVTDESGKKSMREVPEFLVTVRPNSNFPQRFEYKLQFLMNLARTPSPDGKPYVPREALLDVLSEFDPRLGRDGEYYQMSEALFKGLQAIAEEQKRKMADMKTKRTLMGAVRKRGIRELMGEGVSTKGGAEGPVQVQGADTVQENPLIESSHQ